MRNDHYKVRKKAHKHGKCMKQIHQVAWKFGTQNPMTTCILNLRQNLEHFYFKVWEVKSPTLQMVCKLEQK